MSLYSLQTLSTVPLTRTTDNSRRVAPTTEPYNSEAQHNLASEKQNMSDCSDLITDFEALSNSLSFMHHEDQSNDRLDMIISSPVRPAEDRNGVNFFSPSAQKFAIAQIEAEKEKLLDELHVLKYERDELEKDRVQKNKEIKRLEELLEAHQDFKGYSTNVKKSFIASANEAEYTCHTLATLHQTEALLERIQLDLENYRKEMKVILKTPAGTPLGNKTCIIDCCTN